MPIFLFLHSHYMQLIQNYILSDTQIPENNICVVFWKISTQFSDQRRFGTQSQENFIHVAKPLGFIVFR